jgi:hypothetical protein
MSDNEKKLRTMLEELLKENMRLKDENNDLKAELQSMGRPNNNSSNQLEEFKRISSIFFGYRTEVTPEYIQLISMYSYDESDTFIFKRTNDSVSLLNNDFANSFSSEIQKYMENGQSIPAFLAAVTLNLFNQKTFG